jgi:hypothetical protein
VATNPVQIQLNPFAQGFITCNAHAAYFQRVTLTWNGGGVVFQGTGENVAMTDPAGEDLYTLPASAEPMTISAKFEYSTTGPNGTFSLAQVEQPVIHKGRSATIIDVTSEDSKDNDDNDSILSLMLIGVRNP